MEAELTALEDKISQLVQLTQKLRKDNSQLRQNLASVQSENKRLSDKVNSAKTRLEPCWPRFRTEQNEHSDQRRA